MWPVQKLKPESKVIRLETLFFKVYWTDVTQIEIAFEPIDNQNEKIEFEQHVIFIVDI